MTISKKSAMKIYYYLMAVDGKISSQEKVKFEEIGTATDEKFKSYEKTIEEECTAQINKAFDESEKYEVIKEGVEELLPKKNDMFAMGFTPFYDQITANVMVWNMLTIANCDDEYSKVEQNLIRYICRKLDVKKELLIEMENVIKTVSDIDKETEYIKHTSKPYDVINAEVEELKQRKRFITNNIKILLAE